MGNERLMLAGCLIIFAVLNQFYIQREMNKSWLNIAALLFGIIVIQLFFLWLQHISIEWWFIIFLAAAICCRWVWEVYDHPIVLIAITAVVALIIMIISSIAYPGMNIIEDNSARNSFILELCIFAELLMMGSLIKLPGMWDSVARFVCLFIIGIIIISMLLPYLAWVALPLAFAGSLTFTKLFNIYTGR